MKLFRARNKEKIDKEILSRFQSTIREIFSEALTELDEVDPVFEIAREHSGRLTTIRVLILPYAWIFSTRNPA